MGNQICSSNQYQSSPPRVYFHLQQMPQNKGDQLNIQLSLTRTLTIRQSQHQSPKKQNPQLAQIIYQNYLIKCKPSQVKYIKSQQLKTQSPSKNEMPLINGIVKVYNKNKPKQIIYQGQLKNSLFNGYGKLYQSNQLIYQGEFKNNLFDGWGITKQYTGQFRDGVYDGYGIYQQFSNFNTVSFYYQGYFQNGLYSGSGVLIKDVNWPVKQVKRIHNEQGISDFLCFQIQHGMDVIKKYGAKQIYIGQFSNGFRHGFGRLFTDKMEFSGQFSHNVYHGIGKIYRQYRDYIQQYKLRQESNSDSIQNGQVIQKLINYYFFFILHHILIFSKNKTYDYRIYQQNYLFDKYIDEYSNQTKYSKQIENNQNIKSFQNYKQNKQLNKVIYFYIKFVESIINCTQFQFLFNFLHTNSFPFFNYIMGNQQCTGKKHQQLELNHQSQINIFTDDQQKDKKLFNQKHNHLKKPTTDFRQKIYADKSNTTLLYHGQLKNSKFNGYGKLFQNGKLVYQGQFKDGKFEGWGIMDQYSGQFRQGKFDGFGVMKIFSDANREIVQFYYQGYFFDGLFSGSGLQIKNAQIPNQKLQTVQNTQGGVMDFVFNSIERGNTIQTIYKTEEVYIGQFSHGYRHGIGRLFKNNREHSGLFSGGNYMGKNGTVIDPTLQSAKSNKEFVDSKGCCKVNKKKNIYK